MGRRNAWGRGVCAAIIALGIATPAWAGDQGAYMDGALRKLGRGIANVVGCPVEAIRTPELTVYRDGFLAGATVGVLHGLWRTVLRGTAGIYEVATFFVEIPKGFKPLMQPEFVLGTSFPNPEPEPRR